MPGSYDIGPKIGMDGEAEFRKSLQNINQQLKTLGSEMKAVTSAFDAGDNSEEKLAAQTGVLNKQIDAQEKKLQQLQKGLDASARKYGENDTRTLKWAQAVNNATADLNRMRSQLSQTERGMDDLGDATEDAADALEDAGSRSSGFGDMLKSAFLGGGISGAVQSLIGGVKDLVEDTSEYRRIMASLEVSSQRAGYSAEDTAAVYRTLYGVLGDDQTAATTTANLQAIGLAQEQLNQITNATIGAWATYGDSIPIDSLSEAINETIQVGQVTGTFADVLNWAGVSEDAFNSKLEAAATPAERANLVLQQLASQGLVQAGQAWQQNNADIVAANQATASLSDTMAGFGKILSPVVASAKQGFADLLGDVLSVAQAFQEDGLSGAVQQAGELVSGFVDDVKANAPAMMEAGQEMLTQLGQGIVANAPKAVDAIGQAVAATLNFLAENGPEMIAQGGEMLGKFVQGLISGIPDMLKNLPRIIQAFVGFVAENLPAIAGAGVDIIGGLIKGLISAIPEIVAMLPQIVLAIVNGLAELGGSLLEAGKEIVRGILDGITSMGTWLKNQITTFCTGVLDGFLSFFGIHSPSRLMRDRVGVPIIQGVALGMRKGLPEVRETAGQIGSAIEDEISKVNGEIARMEQEEIDRQAAEELAEHKKKLAELYDELGRAAWDERQDVLDEIAELQADWDAKQAEEARKAEKEAAQARLEELEAFQERYQDTLDELEEAYQDSYDEITGMQADMAEALAGYGDLFTEADDVVELGDLRSQVNDIRRYGEALKELEGRGISDSLMSEITGMSVEDALAYTEELLGLTDRQYEEYMELWETKQAEAQRVAQEFYASELRALSDEYVNKIPEAVSGLKNEMADLGMDSALGLAEGFASMETSVGNIFTQTIQRAVDAAKAAMGIHSPSTVWRDQVGAMMAQGLADGFTQRLRAVAGNMTAAIPSAADQFGSIAAGVVNGVQTAVAGGGNYRVEIPIIINGREFSRAILPDLRAVEKSNPEVVSGV